MSASVWGVGTSMFGKQPELSTNQLVWTAVTEALRDAGVESVDAVFVGTCFGEPGIAQRSLHRMGISGLPISIYENACASSTQAFHEATVAIDQGRYETVLVVGVEHLTSRFSGAIPVEQRDPEGRAGLGLPALYAMGATRYQQVHGVTDAQLAAVSVKNHANGTMNPRAQHGRHVSIEQVLASPMISDPLTLLQCCAISDGAGAAVLGSRRRTSRDIEVMSSSMATGQAWDHRSENVWGFELIRDTAALAYQKAGVGIGDINVLEVHDAFTIGEIVTTEALGMAPVGRGGELVESGWTSLSGAQPVNPSGGLLSRGHPLGATGTAQLAEIVWQLRGDAGARQVKGASLGLLETMGGGAGGVDGNACVVSVLSR
ncbi:thiolase family protein [Arthrobacter sp. ISL-28]|uniref:thiolase family protein n=1 Tax=Arthrobacter sp. ISL-28 TaxID=2819108 RepID=UPI001BEA87BD|nr:thiolase family protein [Arthrobacter sp. ISL-28]MBT2523335.1 thiolase family protein [Arthrobacter sp. ISL-28]